MLKLLCIQWKVQIEVQRLFCYLESQLWCSIATFLDPRLKGKFKFIHIIKNKKINKWEQKNCFCFWKCSEAKKCSSSNAERLCEVVSIKLHNPYWLKLSFQEVQNRQDLTLIQRLLGQKGNNSSNISIFWLALKKISSPFSNLRWKEESIWDYKCMKHWPYIGIIWQSTELRNNYYCAEVPTLLDK